VKPVRIRGSALAEFLSYARVAERCLGKVEVASLLLAEQRAPDLVVAMPLLRGIEVDAVSFTAPEAAVLSTLESVPAGHVVVGVAHLHPSGDPPAHSAVDVAHIEAELLPFIASIGLSRPRLSTQRRALTPQLDADGWHFTLDALGRAVLRPSSSAESSHMQLEIQVSEASALSLVVLGPVAQFGLWAMRQDHLFSPTLGNTTNAPLSHEMVSKVVDVRVQGRLESPISDADAERAIRRWVRRRMPSPVPCTLAKPPPSSALVREHLTRIASETHALGQAVVQLIAQRAEQKLRALGAWNGARVRD
jgi:proteasome lid subunit RPN8/RPN11